jgi:hypothetical protein
MKGLLLAFLLLPLCAQAQTSPPSAAPSAAKVARLTCLMIARDRDHVVPHFTTSEPRGPGVHTAAAWNTARRTVDAMPDAEALTIWNRACAGATGRDGWPPIFDIGRDMTLRADGRDLRVTGMIREGFLRQLRDALDANPDVTRVALSSPGGTIREAFGAAELIRERGLDTTLIGGCLSACSFVFLGGTRRDIPLAHWPIGFHQAAWRNGDAISVFNPTQLHMFAKLSSLGVEAGTIMGWINDTAPEAMYIPDTEQLCATGIAPVPACGPKARRAR